MLTLHLLVGILILFFSSISPSLACTDQISLCGDPNCPNQKVVNSSRETHSTQRKRSLDEMMLQWDKDQISLAESEKYWVKIPSNSGSYAAKGDKRLKINDIKNPLVDYKIRLEFDKKELKRFYKSKRNQGISSDDLNQLANLHFNTGKARYNVYINGQVKGRLESALELRKIIYEFSKAIELEQRLQPSDAVQYLSKRGSVYLRLSKLVEEPEAKAMSDLADADLSGALKIIKEVKGSQWSWTSEEISEIERLSEKAKEIKKQFDKIK